MVVVVTVVRVVVGVRYIYMPIAEIFTGLKSFKSARVHIKTYMYIYIYGYPGTDSDSALTVLTQCYHRTRMMLSQCSHNAHTVLKQNSHDGICCLSYFCYLSFYLFCYVLLCLVFYVLVRHTRG